MQGFDFIFSIAILIMSVIAHEVSHGYAADSLGDPTARLAGRLSLNPIKHLDLVGSFIVPVITFFLGGFIFGWAKPVPYNPYNVRGGKWGEAFVGFAGPAMNLTIALVFGLAMRFGIASGVFSPSAAPIVALIVFINILLAVFNLVPIPPLDGSKVLFALLPFRFHAVQEFFERYSLFIILLFVLFFWQYVVPMVYWLFRLITGGAFL
ncbi:MAG: site-2 protease family protein [Candidatus Lloydbacteria bacterium]|nr:site-2 protease family protein [Candidatus Lloydbacteria bacterium]